MNFGIALLSIFDGNKIPARGDHRKEENTLGLCHLKTILGCSPILVSQILFGVMKEGECFKDDTWSMVSSIDCSISDVDTSAESTLSWRNDPSCKYVSKDSR